MDGHDYQAVGRRDNSECSEDNESTREIWVKVWDLHMWMDQGVGSSLHSNGYCSENGPNTSIK